MMSDYKQVWVALFHYQFIYTNAWSSFGIGVEADDVQDNGGFSLAL